MITPYVLASALAALVAAAVAVGAWQRRAAPGGRPLVGLMVAVAAWSAGAAFEYAAIGIPNKVFWAKAQYLGVVTVPVFYLLLAIEYCHLEHWLTRRRIAWLLVVPCITLLMVITNDWHGLIWPAITLTSTPADNLAQYSHGPAFWIGSVGYGYLLMVIATGLFIRAALRFPTIYRRQALTLIAAALAPWFVNIIYILGLSPVPGLEPTPLVLVVTGIVFVWSLLRLRLLDLAPVARATLVETMADGVVVLDVFDRVADINPSAQRFLSPGAPIPFGQPAATTFAGWLDWQASFGATREACLELTLPAPSPCTLELIVTPIHDRRGQFSGRLVVMHDITERKQAQNEVEVLNRDLEERVIERTHELQTTQERFRQVVTSISDHVFALRVKRDGGIETLYNSPRLAEMTGFSLAELNDDLVAILHLIAHPDDHEAVATFYAAVLENGAGELEYRWVGAGGAVRWMRTRARAQVQGDDTIIFGISSDITERRHLEAIALENRTLAELDRLRAELVSNVSHELRTPLGLIKAASTTLLRQDVTFPPATQEKILQDITVEADRLEQLVANLLDISKLDNDRFFLNLEQVDLNTLATTLVEAMRASPAVGTAPKLQLVINAPAAPVLVMADAAKIEQVLRNLLENAVRYSPEGGVISVDVCTDDETCTLRVADHGIGIAPDEQEHVFERFFRSRDARVQRIRGAGLGLAICQEIANAHGGTLTLASTPGAGSVFTMHLPGVTTASGGDVQSGKA